MSPRRSGAGRRVRAGRWLRRAAEWRVRRAPAPRRRRAASRRRPPAPPPAPAAPVSYGSAFGLGAAEDGDHFRALARDAQQLPASLPHVGAPPDQLLPFLRGRAKDAQVRYLLPLGRIRFGRRRHGEAGGPAPTPDLSFRRSAVTRSSLFAA